MVVRTDFADDDDGEVLFRVALKGVDLQVKRVIDFWAYTKDRQYAERIKDDLESYGYEVTISEPVSDNQDPKCSIRASISMRPDYELLKIEQNRINRILSFYSTTCDGWGTEV
jgi:regulator of RNase E activity RraB